MVKTWFSSRLSREIAECFQQPQRTRRNDVRRILRLIKAHPHMGLCTQVVDLFRLDLVDQTSQASSIRQVSVVKTKGTLLLVRIRIDVIEAICIKGRGPADNAMNFVPFGK